MILNNLLSRLFAERKIESKKTEESSPPVHTIKLEQWPLGTNQMCGPSLWKGALYPLSKTNYCFSNTLINH